MHRFLPITFFAIAASAQLTEIPSDAFASAIVVIGGAVQAGTNGTTSLATYTTSSSPAEDTTKAIDAIIGGVRAGSNATETPAEITASPTTVSTIVTTLATTSAESSAAASQTGNAQGMINAAPRSGLQGAGLAAALAIGAFAFAV
ncbi:hypothetical protein BDZ85DRAFT_254316 [Elsinoe ampelina]|uniref:GPI anchored protein n=1 Tax=Elsinoe ampelina TaxID=302913 RepID=A0A6A6GPX8_9PEZI|nr:hypothetical protein BDZ85DRAFT_254316 [Elsinoe ampelina]